MTNSLRRTDPWLGIGMILLGIGLAMNTLLGPLFLGVVTYPFTESVFSETLGLEAISLVLIAPLAVVAGVVSWRRHPVGPLLAIGPASYASYMLVQYVVGPQYPTHQPSVAGHLALFVLGAAVLIRSWNAVPVQTARVRHPRVWATVIGLMTAFVVSRWLPALTGLFDNAAVPAAAPDLTMYWSIFLLDMGIIVPAGIATGVALVLRRAWAGKALYGLVGWFALVPPSVAAMSIVKLVRGDPAATVGTTMVFVVVTLIFWVVAVVLFRGQVAAGGGRATTSQSGEARLRSSGVQPN